MDLSNIDEHIDSAIQPLSEFLASYVFYSVPVMGQDIKLILVWMVVAALFFTIYLGFVNVRYFGHAINILRGKYDKDGGEGQINRFQALATSLSGTVGLGNIAGVAVAVSVGGPGAIVWMILMGFFGMSTKFVEVTLGVKYRHHTDQEHRWKLSGGPMFYLRDAFANRGIPFVGPFMAMLFAICCIGGSLGGGNMFQVNQAYQQALNVTGGEASFLADKGWMFGLFMAFLVGIVIIGGIKSIAAAASRIVPIMGGIYIFAGLVVIGVHAEAIPESLTTIFRLAFSLEAGMGAFVGAMLMGIQRAVFSNEAGIGTAAIAHSNARTDQPVSQGLVGMLGPFIDTIIICTVTGLLIVISGEYLDSEGMEGVALTSRAFETAIPWFPYVLALTVFLFAYSTMLAWSYYGLKSFTFLFGDNDITDLTMKIIFLVFIVIGASADLSNVILFTDAMIFAMAIPNIIGLYVLAPEIKRDIREYIQTIKSSTEKASKA